MNEKNIVEFEYDDGTITTFEAIETYSMGKNIFCLLKNLSNGEKEVVRCRYKRLGVDLELIESKRQKNKALLFYQANFSKNFKPTEEELQILYKIVKSRDFETEVYNHKSLGDDMELMLQNINGWWKPRFLLDHRNKTASVLMNSHEYLRTITEKDINWNSLKGVEKDIKNRAKSLYAGFPFIISNFVHDIAQVEWQINPDGLYYMDDEGFGRTNDQKIAMIGRINRKGKAIGKFSCVK